MAATDSQVEDLAHIAVKLGTEHYEAAVYGGAPAALLRDPQEILDAIFDVAREADMRTDDEFDAVLTVEDLPAPEDRRYLVVAYLARRQISNACGWEIDLSRATGHGLREPGRGPRCEIRLGDRVRHLVQKYNYSRGTATVVGFADEVGGESRTPVGGAIFVVTDGEDDLCGSRGYFDGDRTVLVSFESFADWERELRGLRGSSA